RDSAGRDSAGLWTAGTRREAAGTPRGPARPPTDAASAWPGTAESRQAGAGTWRDAAGGWPAAAGREDEGTPHDTATTTPDGLGTRRGARHPVRLGLYALVLFGLLAGSAAWLAVDKSVRLTVDGEPRTISTYASTVGGVLDDAGITVSDRDVLAPAKEARISDGAEIVLRRGRLLRLTIDGRSRQVWVTATTVQEALDQVGFRQSGLFVSATRSARLPLEGYDLTVRTPKTVTVLADGRRQRVVTTAATVGQILDEAGIRVDGDDKVSQLATAPVVTGMTITVTRVSRKTTTTRTVLRYDTVEKTDAGAAVGSRIVTTKGADGVQQVTYVETYVDGKLTSRKIAKVTVLKQPVDEVVVIGPEPPAAQPAGCAAFPTTGGLNWCGLAKCESGLNPDAYNPAGPYYGLYQFDQGTWTANGGTGSPSGKSIAEQTRVAYNLYQVRGRAPWPVCGRYL
ncbi:MAG: ubiquitin-like domain-containing protein, partial [Mycobacteriales bacterium]